MNICKKRAWLGTLCRKELSLMPPNKIWYSDKSVQEEFKKKQMILGLSLSFLGNSILIGEKLNFRKFYFLKNWQRKSSVEFQKLKFLYKFQAIARKKFIYWNFHILKISINENFIFWKFLRSFSKYIFSFSPPPVVSLKHQNPRKLLKISNFFENFQKLWA